MQNIRRTVNSIIEDDSALATYIQEEKDVSASILHYVRECGHARRFLALWGKKQEASVQDMTENFTLLNMKLDDAFQGYADSNESYRRYFKTLKSKNDSLNQKSKHMNSLKSELAKLTKHSSSSTTTSAAAAAQTRMQEVKKTLSQVETEVIKLENEFNEWKLKELKITMKEKCKSLEALGMALQTVGKYGGMIVDEMKDEIAEKDQVSGNTKQIIQKAFVALDNIRSDKGNLANDLQEPATSLSVPYSHFSSSSSSPIAPLSPISEYASQYSSSQISPSPNQSVHSVHSDALYQSMENLQLSDQNPNANVSELAGYRRPVFVFPDGSSTNNLSSSPSSSAPLHSIPLSSSPHAYTDAHSAAPYIQVFDDNSSQFSNISNQSGTVSINSGSSQPSYQQQQPQLGQSSSVSSMFSQVPLHSVERPLPIPPSPSQSAVKNSGVASPSPGSQFPPRYTAPSHAMPMPHNSTSPYSKVSNLSQSPNSSYNQSQLPFLTVGVSSPSTASSQYGSNTAPMYVNPADLFPAAPSSLSANYKKDQSQPIQPGSMKMPDAKWYY
ncbi:hypothetical protein BKA69DRAFT_1124421 [Paraphysoderma sedebokerense]|nr:hypothetical protein BKA69DRAFT_1124421 [Paraphysoderma sedebokerense]